MDTQIILLTKSRKYNNYCIAGIELRTGSWVRLVSDDQSIQCAVPATDCMYEDGDQAQILDVVHIRLSGPAPLSYQPENVQYNRNFYWALLRKADLQEVKQGLRQHADPYAFYNSEKRLSSAFVQSIPKANMYSLKLIFVARATLQVYRWTPYEKMKHRLSFQYNGHSYNDFSITDDVFIRQYPELGAYMLNHLGLVISLGEPFDRDSCHYKLVASVIPL